MTVPDDDDVPIGDMDSTGRELLDRLRKIGDGAPHSYGEWRSAGSPDDLQDLSHIAARARAHSFHTPGQSRGIRVRFIENMKLWPGPEAEPGVLAAIEATSVLNLHALGPMAAFVRRLPLSRAGAALKGHAWEAFAGRLLTRIHDRRNELIEELWDATKGILSDEERTDCVREELSRSWNRPNEDLRAWVSASAHPPRSLCIFCDEWVRIERYNPRLPCVYITTRNGEVSLSLHALLQFRWPDVAGLSKNQSNLIHSYLDAARTVGRRSGEVEKLYWTLLPPAEPGTDIRQALARFFPGSPTWSVEDWSRLEEIEKHGPDRKAVGLDELKGYIAFVFDSRGMAVADCPRTGNAIYLLRGDWKALSRRSKSDLLASGVQRIFHSGDWQGRLRAALSRKTRP